MYEERVSEWKRQNGCDRCIPTTYLCRLQQARGCCGLRCWDGEPNSDAPYRSCCMRRRFVFLSTVVPIPMKWRGDGALKAIRKMPAVVTSTNMATITKADQPLSSSSIYQTLYKVEDYITSIITCLYVDLLSKFVPAIRTKRQFVN